VRPENELSQYSAEHNLNIISPFGLSTSNRLPHLAVTSEKREKAISLLRKEDVPLDKPLIAFHPFSLWSYKEWGINKGVSLIDYLGMKHGFSVVVTGSLEEQPRADQLLSGCKTRIFNLAGKTSIGELPAVLKLCRLFLGVDTAALHIAAAVGVPTVGIFGPSSPISWAPRGPQHIVIAKTMECVPCRQKGCQNNEVSRCLEELTIEEVKEKVDEHIKRLLI
jgi:heptosyltransferase-3